MCSDGPAYFTCRIFDSQAIARVSMIFSVGCFNYIKYVIPPPPIWTRTGGTRPPAQPGPPETNHVLFAASGSYRTASSSSSLCGNHSRPAGKNPATGLDNAAAGSCVFSIIAQKPAERQVFVKQSIRPMAAIIGRIFHVPCWCRKIQGSL